MDKQQLKDALEWQLAIGADAALLDQPAGDVAPQSLSKWLASTNQEQISAQSETKLYLQSSPVSDAAGMQDAPFAELNEAGAMMPSASVSHAGTEQAKFAGSHQARNEGAAASLSRQAQAGSSSPDGNGISLSHIDTLEGLKQALQQFEGCALKQTASHLVFADGNPDAKIMLIGEAPGRDEDRLGLPFVGAAGQLLDKMLKSIGLDRTSVYICNILPWRPPGNRTPTVEETQMLWPFLMRHIQLKAPDIIMALGGSSAKLLLDETTGILKLRGRIVERDFGLDRPIPVLPSLHPAYLLRSPGQKRLSYQDLLTLKNHMSEVTS